MKKTTGSNNDELRPEYDLKSLQVRKLGSGRKRFGDFVRLEPDVTKAFPSADSVNEALRSLFEPQQKKVQEFVELPNGLSRLLGNSVQDRG